MNNKFFLFISWMLKRMFGGVGRVYQSYDKMITADPLLALLPTIFTGLIVFILSTGIAFIAKISVDNWLIFMWISGPLIFLNYFRILLREQYKKFIREREQIFDILKDTE
jgi:hypothetical protein